MKNTATVHTRAWYGDEELTLNFPSDWEVEMFAPKDAPALSDAQIERAFAEPIGTPRISELAKGKKSATIIVDDLSRSNACCKNYSIHFTRVNRGECSEIRDPVCCRRRCPPTAHQ